MLIYYLLDLKNSYKFVLLLNKIFLAQNLFTLAFTNVTETSTERAEKLAQKTCQLPSNPRAEQSRAVSGVV